MHPKKIYLQHYTKGVQFLGVVIKPNRIYVARRTKSSFYKAIQKQNAVVQNKKPDKEQQAAFLSSLNSYLGIMRHYKTHRLRKKHADQTLVIQVVECCLFERWDYKVCVESQTGKTRRMAFFVTPPPGMTASTTKELVVFFENAVEF